MSLNHSRETFLELSLNFLWRQWSAIGVAGHARSSDSWIIDPEALLLFSTSIARYDVRLFDEIFDWLHLHGSLLNLTRLKNIQKKWQIGDTAILAAISSSLAEQSMHRRWKTFATADIAVEAQKKRPQALFTIGERSPQLEDFGNKIDPHFKEFGLLRHPPALRGMSMAPLPGSPTNFLFKTRWLFGLQSRAEIIPWLLANPSGGHPAEISRQTAYSKRIIQQTLNELESSGHVLSRRSLREKHFRIISQQWDFLSKDVEFPNWICWPPIFAALTRMHQALSQPGLADRSETFQAIKLRAAMENLPLHFSTIGGETGSNYLQTLLKDFQDLLNE